MNFNTRDQVGFQHTLLGVLQGVALGPNSTGLVLRLVWAYFFSLYTPWSKSPNKNKKYAKETSSNLPKLLFCPLEWE